MQKLVFNRNIRIQDREICDEAPVFFIAEAGINHNGDMDLAYKLVDVAAGAGVDAVKFQSFKTENLILKHVEKADYQKERSGRTQSQFEMLKNLEISIQQAKELKQYCDQKGLVFLTTPFDEFTLAELDNLDLPAYKIASTDLTNISFLRQVAQKGKPIILSTGMSYLREVDTALQTIHLYNRDVILLQCTANYPIADEEAHLRVIETYSDRYHILVGFSDHTVGIGATPYAVAKGAKVVEKHFTLDKTMVGPDHSASLNSEELKACCVEIRKVESYLGKPGKKPIKSELRNREKLQKCLVASQSIEKGELFTPQNVTAKRTGGSGISAYRYDEVIGCSAPKKFLPDDLVELLSDS